MKIILLFWVLCFGLNVHAQSGSQVKPMLKQIALLRTYIGFLEKGYNVARKGLNTISDIKNKHWNLDISFFNSLKNVNPIIKNYTKVATIIGYQLQIAKACSRLKKLSFNADEMGYIKSVADHLVNETIVLADQLAAVITDKQFQMSDDERIKKIDDLYDEAFDQYSFIRDFSNESTTLLLQRAKEKRDIHASEKLYGL